MLDTVRATLYQPLRFRRGAVMHNRFMLAPLTNMQSHADGTLSEEEYHWLTLRAKGGHGLTMTCAAAVSQCGKAWDGQLCVFDEIHLPGMKRLAGGIQKEGSLAMVQLHHGGLRADKTLTESNIVAPSDHAKSGARALTTAEIEALIEAFARSAALCETAGFDGVELHAAHSYLICQFLSAQYNQRTDNFGGSLENRARFLRTVLTRIREVTAKDFIVGIRLSPERFGLDMQEMRELAGALMAEGQIDFLDMSFWDFAKMPEQEGFKNKRLIDCFSDIPRHGVRFGVSGKIRTPADVITAMDAGGDFVILGRASIIHHNFPKAMRDDIAFQPLANPVSAQHLAQEGLSPPFIEYMRSWEGFVAD